MQLWDRYRHRITPEQISQLETITRNQDASPVWFEHRKGQITGKKIHVFVRNPVHSCDNLVRRITGAKTYDLTRNVAVQWGVSNEAKARLKYINEQRQLHREFTCEKVSFLIDHKNPFLEASPDGIINCACCGRGVLEIKCPFKHRNSSIDEAAMSDAAFCLNRQGQLKKLHRYYSQVQLQMCITETLYCHFCIYTKVDMKVLHVEYDASSANEMVKIANDFFMSFVLGELVTGRLQCAPSISPAVENDPVDVYCLCNQPLKEHPPA